MSQTVTTHNPTADSSRTEKPKRRWLLPTALGIGGLVIGTGLGAIAAGISPVEETEEYQALSAELEQVKSDWAEAEATLDERESVIETAENDAMEMVAEAESEVATIIQDAEAELASVEVKIEELDASNIEPGVYLVPQEMSPGQYRRVASEGYCYIGQYVGDDIVDNTGTDQGRTLFNVTDVEGSWVEINPRCGTIQKIG